MTYLIIGFILLVVFSYFATLIDDLLDIHDVPTTIGLGVIICIVWPLAIGIVIISVPMVLIMRLGAKHRNEL